MREALPTFDQVIFYKLYAPDRFGPTFACVMIDTFLELTPPLLDALDAALDAHDNRMTERLMHQLKGSASGVAGLHLALLAQKQEDSTPLQDTQGIRAAFEDLVIALRSERELLSDE